MGTSTAPAASANPHIAAVQVEPLKLQPGERVRVKSLEEILATLDQNGCFERLAFMQTEMERYCGRELRVLKRVDQFFDERTRRLLKLRNVVLLENAFCEPAPDADHPFAGCKRTCFLFWKEGWLNRVSEGD
jgi:hypothetical protein